MTLETARIQFAKVSGRYDLINTDDSDNGANWYIQYGQKYLDHHPLMAPVPIRTFQDIAADAYYLSLERFRVIEEVWINNDEGRSKLTKKDLNWLRAEYSSTAAETDSGTPLYYAVAKKRGSDITAINSLATFFNYVVAEASAEGTQGILLLPPPDEAVTVEVSGLGLADDLSSDNDTNFWTENHENILILAGLRELEIFYRNTAGVKDYEKSIDDFMRMLDMTYVQEEIVDLTEMTG